MSKEYEHTPELSPEHLETNLILTDSKVSVAELEHIKYRRKNIAKALSSVILAISALGGFELYSQSNRAKTYPESKTVLEQSTTKSRSKTVNNQAKTVNAFYQGNSLFSASPTFSQNFAKMPNGNLNQSVWNIYNGPAPANHEADFDTNSLKNVRIDHGQLIIEAIKQNYRNYQYTSGRINTVSKENFLYGKFEIVAKYPKSVGTWPAIWLMSSNSYYASLSPSSDPRRYLNDGEIDMAESIGAKPNILYEVIHTAHIDRYTTRGDYTKVKVPNLYSSFNEYGLDWTPNDIKFTINGVTYFNYPKPTNSNYTTWPFNKPFSLVIDLGIGGYWAGQDSSQYPPLGINNSALPAELQIKSINYYKYTGSSNSAQKK